ncbi:MAG: hypothetical protein MI919_06460, partial [Holophagales bacterium]|nr:hypothetical protein [Holophagales bacterium]
MTENIAEFPGIEEGFLTGSVLGRRWARRMLLAKLGQAESGRSRDPDRSGAHPPESFPLRWIDAEAGIDTLFGPAAAQLAPVTIRV